METRTAESVREHHHPDWPQVLLGVLSAYAVMGILALVGVWFRLFRFSHGAEWGTIWLQAIWGAVCVLASGYAGGYVSGRFLSRHNRVAAAMNGLLVWEAMIVGYALIAWLGYSPFPGVTFRLDSQSISEDGLIWMIMAMSLAVPFTPVYGAMRGNDAVGAERAREEDLRAAVETPERPPREKSKRVA